MGSSKRIVDKYFRVSSKLFTPGGDSIAGKASAVKGVAKVWIKLAGIGKRTKK